VASSEKAATTGATPLHFAARAGHMEVQMALLGAGAVATEPDAYGRTPLQEAAFNGHQHCARHLLALTSKGESAHAVQDDYGMTALHWAVLGGHSACITILRGTNASASTDKHRQADIETAQVMVQFSSREHLQPSLRSV
jgi:ankyrin repeat protein